MTVTIGRRELLAALGGAAAAGPLAAGAQQPTMPVVGYLNADWPGPNATLLAVFRQSLAVAGYVEGCSLAIEYHWAEGQYDRLPVMAAELVRRQVAVIVAAPIPAAVAARAATATVPIVFSVAGDPVKLGLVADLARPGGNATGVNFFQAELGAKQLGLLRELLPRAAHIGLLVNPSNANVEGVTKDVTAAAATIGLQIAVVRASDAARSKLPSRCSSATKPTRSWSALTRSSSTGGSSLSPWRHAMRSPPSILFETLRKPAA